MWEDRLLGITRMVRIPARAMWIITGNNIRLRGDMPRRCVWCRLDAKMARPWMRKDFRHPDLLAWTREHRCEILCAIFTLARGWIAAGRPGPADGTPRLGSFERWCETIGGILRVAGMPKFLGNVEQLYDMADDDTPAWAGFLAAWHRIYGEEAITVSQLVANASKPELADGFPAEIAAALDKGPPASAAKRIGKALSRKLETRYEDEAGVTLRLVREEDTHAKVARWAVRQG
jgi:hypothetical protein